MIMLSDNTKLWLIIILAISVVLLSLYLDSKSSSDSFYYFSKEEPIYPKHGVCEQECYYVSCPNCRLQCETFVRGKPTRGCSAEVNGEGTSLYRCQLSKDEEGNKCMEKLTKSNIKYPYYHLPEKGICKQECDIVCESGNPPSCYTKCYTYVNDSVTLGCENLIRAPGETGPYKCKLSKNLSNEKCMDKA